MVTLISERQIPGLNIYIKKIPNVQSRIMDVFGNKEAIKNFINDISNCLNRNVLNEIISNSDYENENFATYNLRFADLDSAVKEELEIYELLRKENI